MHKFWREILRATLGLTLILSVAACGYNTPPGGGGLTPYVIVVTPTPDPGKQTVQVQTTLTVQAPTPVFTTTVVTTTQVATPGPSPTTADGDTYTVQKGDTLFGIAAKFHVDSQELIKLNNISDPSLLHIGQKLKLPPPKPTPTSS